jgi:hypothetical protein
VKAPISLERLIRIIGKKTYFASEEVMRISAEVVLLI